MSSSLIRQDLNLRELALAEARNAVGAEEPTAIFLVQQRLSQQEYDAILKDVTYRGYVASYTAELRETGFGFSVKAKILAEDLLSDIYQMAKDPGTPAQMRVRTLENLVEWGRLAPKQSATDVAGTGFSVTINMGPATTPQTVTFAAPTSQPPVDAEVLDVFSRDYPTKTLLLTAIASIVASTPEDDLAYLGEDLETQASWAAHAE